MAALQGMNKSKEGMSNSELDELLADNSNWMTVWVVRELTALGFVQYKVDFFGGPARYVMTELGKTALSVITGQPVPQPPPAPAPQPQAKPAPSPAPPQQPVQNAATKPAQPTKP
jgi:hypothetical protein